MKLVFATNNQHKLKEIEQILIPDFKILSLSDINCSDEIPEDHETLEKNASQKSLYIYDKYGVNCFADDTGLEVKGLAGRPGVLSARFAGTPVSSKNNIQKLLKELGTERDRSARFKTVITLIMNKKFSQFEGIIKVYPFARI